VSNGSRDLQKTDLITRKFTFSLEAKKIFYISRPIRHISQRDMAQGERKRMNFFSFDPDFLKQSKI